MAASPTTDHVAELLEKKLEPIGAQLGSIAAQLGKVVAKQDELKAKHDELMAKMANSSVGREEPLTEVPASNGSLPSKKNIHFPPTIMELMVAGNEALPNGKANSWNARHSKRLLRHYGQDVDSDSENEESPKSRALRLRVAKAIGVTRAQLNFAQLTL